jgi:hypothetical protein
MPGGLLSGFDGLDHTEDRADQPECDPGACDTEKQLEKDRSSNGCFHRAEQGREPRSNAGKDYANIDDEIRHNFNSLWIDF